MVMFLLVSHLFDPRPLNSIVVTTSDITLAESVCRETDDPNCCLDGVNGIQVRDITIEKVGFADDVTKLDTDVRNTTITVRNISKAGEPAGLRLSTLKLYV